MNRIQSCFDEGADPDCIDREKHAAWRKELCAELGKAIPEYVKGKLAWLNGRMANALQYSIEGGNRPRQAVDVLITLKWLESIAESLKK